MDGRKLALPEDLAGVMLLNIQSYMGGVDLWAGSDAPAAAGPSTPQSFDDGQLEVVGVWGVLHLGQLQVRGQECNEVAPRCCTRRGSAADCESLALDVETLPRCHQRMPW